MRALRNAMAIGAALALTACASGPLAGAAAAIGAAGYTLDTYCRLAPAARAKVRAELGLEEQWVTCPSDRPLTQAPSGGRPWGRFAPAFTFA